MGKFRRMPSVKAKAQFKAKLLTRQAAQDNHLFRPVVWPAMAVGLHSWHP